MLIQFLLILLISYSFESYQKSFDSFIELATYEYKTFEGKGEAFFRYRIRELGSDVAIEIPESDELKGEIYVYTTHDKVIKSFDDWTGYMWKFKISSEKVYSIKYYDSKLGYNNLYIVIKMENDIKKNARIRVYKEFDVYSLQLDQTYVLEHFFSRNKMTVSMETSKGNSYEVDIRGNPHNKHRIVVYESGKKDKPLYNITNTICKLILVPVKNTVYLIEVENYYYKHRATKYISYSILHNYQPLEFGIKTLEFYNDESYYFFTDIKNFEPNSEYSITIHCDKKEICDLIKGFNSKLFNLRNLSIDYLEEFYPVDVDQNELKEYSFDVDGQYYKQLFFKSPNEIPKNENILLLTYIQVTYNPSIFTPQQFHVFITSKAEIISLKKKPHLIHSIVTEKFIPKYYTLQVPSSKNFTLFIYCEDSNILEITHGNLLTDDNEVNDKKEPKKEIYILNKQEFDKQNEKYYELTLRFITDKYEPKIYFEITDKNVFLLKENKPKGAHEMIMDNCNNPFYLIDVFKEITERYVYFRSISGNYDIRYKKTYISNEYDSILPNENYKIKNTILTMDGNFEILYISCEAPGILEIYYLEDKNEKEIKVNGGMLLSLTANSKTSILLPMVKEKKNIKSNFFIEQFDYNGKINIKLDNITIGEISIQGTRGYEIDKYPNLITPVLKLYPTEDTVVQVNFNMDNTQFYEITEIGKYLELHEYNILIQIRKDIDFQKFQISMNNIENDFSYQLLKLQSVSHIKYITNVRNSPLHHFVSSSDLYNKQWNYRISDPYDKLKSHYNYYIAISFDERNKMPNYKIKIEYNEKIYYPKLEKNKIIPQFNGMKKSMSGGSKSEYLIVIANKCGDFTPKLTITHFYDNLHSEILYSKYNMVAFKNYYQTLNIELNMNERKKYEGVELSYNFIQEKIVVDSIDMDNYNEMKLMITYEKQFKRLLWEHAVGADHYLVYILPHTEEVKKYITNDCYLLTQKYEKTDVTSFEFSKKGEFYITIVAVFQNPVSYRVVYEPFEIIHKSNTFKYVILLLILLSIALVGYILYLRYKKEKEAKEKE